MARAQTSPRPEKVAVVDEVRALLSEADAAVLSEYRGLSVSALAELRASLRPAGAEYRILKNTLARRAAEEAGCADLVPLLEGPTAITRGLGVPGTWATADRKPEGREWLAAVQVRPPSSVVARFPVESSNSL